MSEETQTTENLPETNNKTKKSSGRGFFSRLISFLTMIIWIFAAGFGSMPWWISDSRVPPIVRKYLPALPEVSGDNHNLLMQINDLTARVEKIEQTEREVTPSLEPSESSPPESTTNETKPADETASVALETSETEKQITEKLAALENRIEDMAKQIVENDHSAEVNEKLADITNKVVAFEEKEKSFEEVISNVSKKENTIAGVEGQLHEIGSKIDEHEQTFSIIASTVLLQEAINAGRPYESEIETLKTVIGEDPETIEKVDSISVLAEQGIPTTAKLINDFKVIAPKTAWSAIKVDNQGILGRVIAKIKNMFSFRRIGENAPDASVEKIVANAEDFVKQGALVEAVSELDKINDEEALKIIGGWKEQAKLRTTADSLLREIVIKKIEALNNAD